MNQMTAGLVTGQGSNSVLVRHFNERVILAILRRMGQASKAEIARQSSLTNNAAGVIVRELEQAGLIREDGKKHSGSRGQPATMLTLVPEGAFGVGVKLDRMSIETVIVDFTGSVIGCRRHTMALPSPDKAIDILVADIDDLVSAIPEGWRSRLTGIGVAAPNTFVGCLEGSDIATAHLEAWEQFDIAAALRSRIEIDVFDENDGNAAAVAELFYGHGRKLNDFIYVFVGPVICGGVVIDSECVRGVTGNAGCFAMIPVAPSRLDSAQASNNSTGKLLQRASTTSLIRHMRFHGAAIATPADVGAAIRGMPDIFSAWLDDCVEALTLPLLSAAAILDMPTIVLDGELDRHLLQEMIGRLQDQLIARSPKQRRTPRLMLGSFGPDAGAIGAASLPMHVNFSPLAKILTGNHAMGRELPQ